jgi:hypothetical protein
LAKSKMAAFGVSGQSAQKRKKLIKFVFNDQISQMRY